MREIRVNKAELIKTMKANREQHAEIVEEAQQGFRRALTERIEAMLADAKAGRKVDMYINLPVPEDHTSEYNTIIGMLEMDINETVDLDQAQYRQWVQDDWGWRDQFLSSNSFYSAKAGADLAKM